MPLPTPRILIALQLLGTIASGCTARAPSTSDSPAESTVSAENVVFTDGMDRRVTLPRHPRRIISLAPSVTEVLYLLGADDRLVGVTTHCTWPEAARAKPKIGDLLNPGYELILAAKPDLVIASTAGNDRSAVLKLADLGLPVFVTAPRSAETIFQTVDAIGRIVDCTSRGEALAAQMRARLDQVSGRLAGLPPTRAFFITWFDPLLTPGKNTFETDALRLAGVESITAGLDEFYPRYSLEQVLARDPEAIVTVRHEGTLLPDLSRLAGWQSLSAVRKGRIYVLNEVFQHPSPRFVEGVEELARKLHPERFP